VETWRGVYPITSFVLNALNKKAAAEAGSDLESTERTLLTACEFWAAAARGTLTKHLKPLPLMRLSAAQQAFQEIGAVRVASSLRIAIGELSKPAAAAAADAIIARLDEQLARTEDEVDQLIAQYAAARHPQSSEWA
jgi:hypothetical protein